MRRALLHLRLPFSVVLAPLFLWGAYLGGGTVNLAAFLVIHVLLYGGMNAFNSCWDRDEGPIGALVDPPPVDRTVLAVALLCQGLALVGGFAVGPSFGGMVALALLLSFFYSHGRFRWKERPWLAALTIFVGQGLLGVLWGLVSAGGAVGPMQLLGAVGGALITTGFYPLTGVYQITADAERGMRTLAVRLGIDGCFAFAGWGAALGGACIAAVLVMRGEYGGLVAAGGIVAAAGVGARRWHRRIRRQSPRENQRELMRLAYTCGVGLSALFIILMRL